MSKNLQNISGFQSPTCPALWEEGRQFPFSGSTRSSNLWLRSVPHGSPSLDQGKSACHLWAGGWENPTSRSCAWGPHLRKHWFSSLPSSPCGSPTGLFGDEGSHHTICSFLLSSVPSLLSIILLGSFPAPSSSPLPSFQL